MNARASFDGVGPVRIGMSIRKAEQAIRMPLAVEPNGEPDWTCRRAWPSSSLVQVSVIVARDIIVRIDIDDLQIETDCGARIGDSEARIKSLYRGPITVKARPTYFAGHEIIVPIPDGERALLFETDGDVVLSYRVRERRIIDRTEGCR